MADRQIEYLSPRRVHAYVQNARTHSKEQIDKICRAIEHVSFINPIITDENHVILAGHGRWQAAEKLDLKKIPVVVVRGLSEAQKRAYRLADNRLAERAGWNRKKVAREFSELRPLLDVAGLDFEWIGFETAEIDLLLGDHVDREDDPADQHPPLQSAAVSRAGDLWILRDHRLLCGNACHSADVAKLMEKQRACMTLSDPPLT
jgi:ParB-like chromosome segregation protein Spo0J